MKLKRASLLICTFFFFIGLYSQDKNQVFLIDDLSGKPIDGAYFRYADQSGISDEYGKVEFEYRKGEIMSLNHLSYGRWQLGDKEVETAIQKGRIYKDMISFDLQPVSVVALHPRTTDTRRIELDYHNRQNHDAGEILTMDPAITSIRKSGVYGLDPVLRGFKYDQLNVVIDGVQTAAAACPNRMDPVTSQVALNMIEHVDILKGPYTLRFGNSFGGTINFESFRPEFSETFRTQGRMSGSWESNGNVLRSEGYIGGSSSKTSFRLFGSLSKGNDYRDGKGVIVPASFMRASTGADFSYRTDAAHQVILSAYRNFGRNTDFPALPMDLHRDDTWMINGRHEILFEQKKLKSWKSMVFGSIVNHEMNNFLRISEPRMVNSESPAKTRTYGARTELNWGSGKSDGFLGADLKIEKASGKRIREFLAGPNAGKIFMDNSWQQGRIAKAAVFSEWKTATKTMTYVFSGRLEINSSSAADTAPEFISVYKQIGEMQINPDISAGAIRNINSRTSLKLWLGRAQRSGSITEKFINFFPVGQDPYELLGNPALKPEINNQADFVYEYKTGRLFLNLDIFSSLMQNYISPVIDKTLKPRLPSSPGVRRYSNTGDAFKSGFELSFAQLLPGGLDHKISMAYTRGKDLCLGKPLPEISPLEIRYRITGNYFDKKLIPEFSLRYAARQKRISREFGESVTPSFLTADIGVSIKVSGFASFSASIQNLFDKAYYEHLNRGFNTDPTNHIMNPGRSFTASFNIEFR
ncbi:MAG: TonB-dependent receptor [Methanosarcina sp.]